MQANSILNYCDAAPPSYVWLICWRKHWPLKVGADYGVAVNSARQIAACERKLEINPGTEGFPLGYDSECVPLLEAVEMLSLPASKSIRHEFALPFLPGCSKFWAWENTANGIHLARQPGHR